ncbi:MAG: DNA translocase FtsK 4TM domain-containing protein [Bacteroidota bacterium]
MIAMNGAARNSSTESVNGRKQGKKSKSPERKRQFLAIGLMLVALLLLLSLVSYTSADQANGEIKLSDFFRVFGHDPDLARKVSSTHNWLSLFGAAISNILINDTVGYPILILPFILFAWGLFLLARKETKKLLRATNYAILLILLVSCSLGMLRYIAGLYRVTVSSEWSGVIGTYGAEVLKNIVGSVGGSIILFGLLFFAIVLAFNVNLTASVHGIKGIFGLLKFRRKKSLEEPQINRTEEPMEGEEIPPEPILPVREVQIQRESMVESHPQKTEHELHLDIKPTPRETEIDFDDRPAGISEQVDISDEEIDYVPPSVELLEISRQSEEVNDEELKANAELLRAKLADFDVDIDTVSVTPGPVVTLYELVPAAGVKISRIVSLADDLALALQAKGIRIIAPIPGKGAVGVEIPNQNPSLVRIRSVINSTKFRDTKASLPLAIGKTISGEVFVDDLTRMPHLLIAGATGSGKSVGINTILTSLLYKLHPSDIKFIIIDPKKIELSLYKKLNKHFLAVSPDIDEEIVTTSMNAVNVLKGCEIEMERRYDMLAKAGVRNIADYNEKVQSGKMKVHEGVKPRKIPYLIIVIDELADLMMTAAKEVEEPIARLAQLARAVGIHLVLATQRPSVDVITGVIKANFSARIAYQVSSKVDSRTILDMNGAEQLLGNGDMLYLPSGSPKPVRIQNAFISTDEVERIVDHIGKQKGYSRPYELPSFYDRKRNGVGGVSDAYERDELFEEAARLIVRHQQGSVSLLQRRLKVGYSRAARLVDELEAAGIVGAFDGSKAREVLVETEAELENILRNL